MADVAEAGQSGNLGDRMVCASKRPLDLAQTLGEDLLADGTVLVVR